MPSLSMNHDEHGSTGVEPGARGQRDLTSEWSHFLGENPTIGQAQSPKFAVLSMLQVYRLGRVTVTRSETSRQTLSLLIKWSELR